MPRTCSAASSSPAGMRTRRQCQCCREERAARERPAPVEKPKAEKPKPAPAPKKQRPSELERLEAEIAQREAEVAEIEAKLATDWTDVDVLAAHKRSRDALTALLARWE